MNLVFKASIDGFAANVFHQKCDQYKNLIVVIKSGKGEVFGGYTNLGFYKDNGDGWIWGYGKSFIF